MKNTYKYIAIAALALGFTACTQDDDFAPQQEDIVQIASVNIATEVQTRVNTLGDGKTWENADQILLINGSRDNRNSGTYTYNGTAWSTSDIVLYASTGTNDFTAYYPAVAEAKYTLPKDQRTTDSIKSADRMVATADDVAKGAAVALSFVRQNAMVTITPSFNTEFGDDATISSLQIAGITPYHPTDAEDYKAIIAPSTTGFTVTLTVEGQSLTATTTTQIEAGKHYTFNLAVGKTAVAVSSVSVEPWGDGGALEGGEATEVINYKYDEESNTYTVNTAEGLLAWNEATRADLTTNLVLAADITLTGENNWTPIGEFDVSEVDKQDIGYIGTIDGAGHTITGLNIKSEEFFTGFISALGESGHIKNVQFANAEIQGLCVAVVASINKGIVENCSVTSGSGVSGEEGAGGIVYWNYKSGVVSGCNNEAAVSCLSYIGTGGIVGLNDGGTVMGCINSGSVQNSCTNNPPMCGGIVGVQSGTTPVFIACGNLGEVSNNGRTDVTGGVAGSIVEGSTIALWTKATTESDNSGDGIGDLYESNKLSTSCHSFTDASEVTAEKITEMNAAIATYNDTAAEGKTCPYTWQIGTDGYPTLVKATE